MASDVIVKFYQSNFDQIRFEKDKGKRAVLIRDCAAWAHNNNHSFAVRTDIRISMSLGALLRARG